MIECLFRKLKKKFKFCEVILSFFLGVFCFNNVNYLFWCLIYYFINVYMDELSLLGLS